MMRKICTILLIAFAFVSLFSMSAVANTDISEGSETDGTFFFEHVSSLPEAIASGDVEDLDLDFEMVQNQNVKSLTELTTTMPAALHPAVQVFENAGQISANTGSANAKNNAVTPATLSAAVTPGTGFDNALGGIRNTVVRAKFQNAGELHFYKTTISAEEAGSAPISLLLRLPRPATLNDYDLLLVDANGNLFSFDGAGLAGQDEQFIITFPYAGLWYILVHAYLHDAAVNQEYQLFVGDYVHYGYIGQYDIGATLSLKNGGSSAWSFDGQNTWMHDFAPGPSNSILASNQAHVSVTVYPFNTPTRYALYTGVRDSRGCYELKAAIDAHMTLLY